jgi:hypothetical protein
VRVSFVGPRERNSRPTLSPAHEQVRISARSALVLEGPGITVAALDLDGALVVKAAAGATVGAFRHGSLRHRTCVHRSLNICLCAQFAVIKRLKVHNAGWELVPLADGEDAPLFLRIRGFKLVKNEQRVLEFPTPGEYVVDEA